MTKDGIEYNLNITPYVLIKDYVDFKLHFKFSSEFYMNKFIEKTHENKIKKPFKKLYPSYNINIDVSIIDDLVEYERIEKRGFQIVRTGILGELIYNNLKEIKINSKHILV